jgi:hypothetical protein
MNDLPPITEAVKKSQNPKNGQGVRDDFGDTSCPVCPFPIIFPLLSGDSY